MIKKCVVLSLVTLLMLSFLVQTSAEGMSTATIKKDTNKLASLSKKECNEPTTTPSSLGMSSLSFNPEDCWAFMLGVDHKDADSPWTHKRFPQRFKNILVDNYWKEDHIQFLTGHDVQKDDLYGALDQFDEKEEKGDTVLLYFNTHGYPRWLFKTLSGGLALGGFNGIFTCTNTYIGYDDLKDALKKLEASNMIVMVSACYSGDAIGQLKNLRSQTNIMVITSSKADETSWGELNFGFCRACRETNGGKIADDPPYGNDDGYITVEEFFSYQQGYFDDSSPQFFDADTANDFPFLYLRPLIDVTTPRQGYLYLFGREIMPIAPGQTQIIGRLTVSVNAVDPEGIEKVMFYIDDTLMATDADGSNGYTWKIDSLLIGKHQLRVVAQDTEAHASSVEFSVQLFCI